MVAGSRLGGGATLHETFRVTGPRSRVTSCLPTLAEMNTGAIQKSGCGFVAMNTWAWRAPGRA